MEEENKSIKEKKQIKKAPENPSVRAEFYESCKCPDYLQKEFPHCRYRMKNGICWEKLIDTYYYEEEGA